MAGKAIAKGLAALLRSDVPAPTGNKLITRTTEPSAIRKIYDELPKERTADIPEQVDDIGIYGYHGSAKGRLADTPEEYFDIEFGNPKDQFLGEGFYFTINPKVAEEYANLRATKDFTEIPGGRGDSLYYNPKTKEKATTGSLMEGKTIEGDPILKGQNVARFDLRDIDKPFVVNNNKQRLYAKENINKIKEEGYDSILFKDFEDRSQQILVFPEHINKVSSPGAKKVVEDTTERIPIMPVNQANLEEKGFEFNPGGEYVNPKTNEILTGKNVGNANIKIVPEMGIKGSRPMASMTVSDLDVPEIGMMGKGNTDIVVNLIKPSKTGKNGKGWKWTKLKDKNFKDVNTLVSVVHKQKHYYTMETDFLKGANLKTYPQKVDEPRLRPYTKGTLDFQDQIGTIKMQGKTHPVYRRIVAKYDGGQIKKGGMVARNPYDYEPRGI